MRISSLWKRGEQKICERLENVGIEENKKEEKEKKIEENKREKISNLSIFIC